MPYLSSRLATAHLTSSRLAVTATCAAAALVGVSLPAHSAASTSATAAAASPDISLARAQAHLTALQDIANRNGGNRATGRPGYSASVSYVKSKLDAAGFVTSVQTFSTRYGTSSNLIAEWPRGDASKVVMIGGHLDSATAGPGINDNGSGVAGVLESALAYAASGQSAKNRLRVAFWGAEEQGLLGSKYYVNRLTSTQKSAIKAYVNADMIGSVNPGYFVYDDNTAGDGVRDDLTDYYDSKGIAWEYIDVQGRSDHAGFRAAGIPTGGLFSGAESVKSAAQASKWGGSAGRAFDPCYHRACDTTSNINATAFDRGIDALGHLTWLYVGAPDLVAEVG